MIRHVFIDFDGTLVDTLPGIERAALTALAQVLPGHPAPDFRRHIGPPVRKVFAAALGPLDERTLDALERAFRTLYDGELWRDNAPFPGVVEAIDCLRANAVRCHILTNKPRTPTLRILDQHGLRDRFEEINTLAEPPAPRIDKPEAARRAAARLGTLPEDTWMIGDARDDAAAAHACGWHFAAACYGYGDAATQMDFPIHLKLASAVELAKLPGLPVR